MNRRTAKRQADIHGIRMKSGLRLLRVSILPRRIPRLARFYEEMHRRDPDGPFWDPHPRITWRCRNKASAGRKRR